jgi:class 3 adenylate cyclase/tetratricopeptide (TPR) repeat protein
MSTERQQIEATIVGLEAQRALLGDAMVDAALVALRGRLAALIAAGEAPTQVLKQATVLFLDIVGSTTLGQKLDPEAASAVLDGALAQFTGIVAHHGGKVLKYAGDSVLAVFGAVEAREDDPERAVRAGLALLEAGREQGWLVRRQHGYDDFNVRVGVHTGGVLLGGGVDAQDNIRGQAVNIAARMEQTAPPGALRISHDTYRHVRGVFTVEPQEPLVVKGMEEPIVTYLVLYAKPRAFRVATRGIEGVETRMIGRDTELAQLQHAFLRVCGESGLVALTVVADAGMGKSRLLYEFQNWAETRPERFKLFRGRADPQTRSQPYGLLRDLLAQRLEIADTDSMETARRKIEQGVGSLFEPADGAAMAQANAHVLGHLIGVDFGESRHIAGIRDDAKQIRSRGFHAAAQMFRRMSAKDRIPVVLLIDDLHWADDGSLDFLSFLAQADSDVPMLVLGLTRPTLFERRPDWNVGGNALSIDLGPLDKDVSRLLVNELLKMLDDVPSALRELITGGAEGNPFYMEELVKMLVDEGAIRAGGEHWSIVPERLVATHVPQTLTGVLQARLDGLDPMEKLALQRAAIVGFVFWDQALAAIDPTAPAALPALVRRELIIPRRDTALDGLREYAFKHQILHQVTYGTVLKRTRRECHAKVAAWLAGQSGVRPNTFLGATARHYEKAGDHERAAEYFARAAEHARERYAHQEALDDVGQALEMLEKAESANVAEGAGPDEANRRLLELRWRLLDVRERMLDLRGQRDEQRADFDALQGLADALDDDRRRGEVAWRRSWMAMRTADYRTQEGASRQAMEFARRAGDEALFLRAKQTLALARNYLGDSDAGKALAEEGLAAARALGFRSIESRFLNALSIVASMREDMFLAVELSRQQLPIDRELGNPRDEAITLGNLGASLMTLGENDEAQQHLEAGLKLARAVGDRDAELVPLYVLSQCALRRGDAERAVEYARVGLDSAAEVRNPPLELLSSGALANAELALGRYEAATAAFERARDVAISIGSSMQYDAVGGLARVALAQDDLPRAMALVDEMLAHEAELSGTESSHLVRLTCYRVLERAGDPRASDVLAVAHANVLAQAVLTSDPALRKSFLHNISEHREIVAAWTAHETAAAGSVATRRSRARAW